MKEITRTTYIQCAECSNISICIPCYCQGKQKDGHASTHKYSVIDPLKFPLFMPSWSAKEELMLLEGLLKYGYGNWNSISEYMGGSKTATECERHYKQIYLPNPNPPSNLLVLSGRDESGRICIQEIDNADSFMDVEIDPPLPAPSARQDPEKHPLMDFAGYMPLRKDFEVEYENDIELYLADMEFYEDDREEDKQIKLRQLDMYNEVLREREERKAFVMERWVQETKNEKKFKNNVIERNIYQAMKPFARFLSPENHLILCQGLVQEYILKLKLEELREAKNLGIKTEQEFRQFLMDKRSNTSRAKEYEAITKTKFMYKQAEEKRDEIIKTAEIVDTEMHEPNEDINQSGSELCSKLGITQKEFQALIDRICEQLQSNHTIQEIISSENIPETLKPELFDYVAKFKPSSI